jgi:hypothetical protein
VNVATESAGEEPRILGLSEPWFFLAIGALTAPLFAATPILRTMGWFLASLTHELGHIAVAWLLGMPAFPAISLAGHAAAFHEDQMLPLVLLIAAGLGAGAFSVVRERARVVAVVLVVVPYLLFALTPLKDTLFLLAGHGGELLIAAIFLRRALTGGLTSSPVERGLYGTVGWFLVGKNVVLTVGLLFSDGARRAYEGNGSFGMRNDYLRLVDEGMGLPLPLIALGMTLVALGTVPAALFVGRLTGGRGDRSAASERP